MKSLPANCVGGESSSPQSTLGNSEGRQRIILFFLKPSETFQDRLSVFKKENQIPKSALGSWTEVIDPTQDKCDSDIFAWSRSDLLQGTEKLILFRDREEYRRYVRVRGEMIKIVLRFGYTGYQTPAENFDILLEESLVQHH